MRNRYPGECRTCGAHVAANTGIYEPQSRWLYCSEPVDLYHTPYSLGLMNGCVATAKLHALFPNRGDACLSAFNAALGTAFASAAEVLSAHFAEHEASKPTAEEVAEVKAQMRVLAAEDRKQRRAEIAAFKASNTCPRCHGAGGSDAWFATGWTCARCHGSGKYHN